MKSIGGYFGLECFNNPLYYQEGIYLNSCRNGLRYLIKTIGIKRIYIPSFTCHVIEEAIRKENCEVKKYNINDELYPIQNIPLDEFIIYNNYFGVTGSNVNQIANQYKNLIVDNAQAFYSRPQGRFSIYSPRKFFGLPDGGILIGKEIPFLKLERGESYEVCSHLLKRIDLGAEKGYKDFIKDDNAIDDYPVQNMSKLTFSMMGNINYEDSKNKRRENFSFLSKNLETQFPLSSNTDDVPLVYPYLLEDGDILRGKLIENKIFCARYWPNVLEHLDSNIIEKNFVRNIVAIPIDQRYGLGDMEHIINIIK